MRHVFYACCDFLDDRIGPNEHYLLWFEGEHSDFVRFNRSAVRQAGNVKQMTVDLRLIVGNRHMAGRTTLTGDEATDNAALNVLLARLRQELPTLSEDPFLLYSNNEERKEFIRRGKLPSAEDAVSQIVAAAQSSDLVGIYASGPICRGLGSSFGSRRWHETESFNFDFSIYLAGDKAVKSAYAGFEWDKTMLDNTIEQARHQLTLLERPVHTLSPGKYRVYLSPSAMSEILTHMSWDGFGIKAQQTRQSPFLRLMQGSASLSPKLTIIENTAEGIAADFEPQGFARPSTVPLIVEGKMVTSLVSPRSAKEFNVPTTGASADESPTALDMAAGDLPTADVLQALDTGIYINNLWYLSYSDRAAGKMTGMTRFATFWVEKGKIVAPVNVMRFDESMYRILGENLERLTTEREYLIDPSSYGARSTLSWRLPGALVRDFTLTL